MKVSFKRLLCLFMALVMLFAFAACDQSEEEPQRRSKRNENTTVQEETESALPETSEATEITEETEKTPVMETSLVGRWNGKVDLSAIISLFLLELDLDVEVEVDECALVIDATFNEDGTAVWVIDEDSVETLYNTLVDAMWNMTVQIMAEELGGVSFGAAEEVLIAQGATKEVLAEEMGGVETDDFEDLEAKWRLDGDQLYMCIDDADEEDSVTIEFGYGTFSIVSTPIEDEEDEEIAKAILPIVFERVE